MIPNSQRIITADLPISVLLSPLTTTLILPQSTAGLAQKVLECTFLPSASVNQIQRKGCFGVIPSVMVTCTFVTAKSEMCKQKHRPFPLAT